MDGASGTTGTDGNSIQNGLTPEGLWRFCLSHYEDPDVKHACLALQDKHQGNVNLALMLIWLESRGFSLDDASLDRLELALEHSAFLLDDYRQIRREVKRQIDITLYRKMLGFELKLEQQQQKDLVAALNQETWLMDEESVVKRYCRRLTPNAAYLYNALMHGNTTATTPK